MRLDIAFFLNGSEVAVEVDSGQRLIDVLRGPLRMTGTKEGCREGECGACTVVVDGRAINSCLYPAPEADGKRITTIEGLLGPENRPSALQECFAEKGGVQCGFCTPGMILSATALLDANPDATREEILEALEGNLCRCTGYVQIVDAVVEGSVRMRERAHG